ncbi:uncharacterized protein J8A68_000575 [[Candida] subhashii]|uniref:DUF1746 domain-containing protein n=1 Tax=[Candida] subhashii TaxID=561895 RepID=A0A8J5QMX7_9ASCO|nr:uncharacterized protein J8A68_000575 [[Candida] subhashii]KAG7665952.1 hypothetical protein J8A68_000575 [[Candida] subhashii]
MDLEASIREFSTQTCPNPEQTIANNKSILYKRKKFFLKDLRSSFQSIDYILIAIAYLRDMSILLALCRLMNHFMIVNSRPIPELSRTSEAYRRSIIKISWNGLVVQNSFCILYHLIFGIPTESKFKDGLLHGLFTVQLIGERAAYSRFEMIGLDFVIFFIQVILHHLIALSEDSELLESSTVTTDTSELESGDRVNVGGDGYDGNVFLLSLDIAENIKKIRQFEIMYEPFSLPGSRTSNTSSRPISSFPGAFEA